MSSSSHTPADLVHHDDSMLRREDKESTRKFPLVSQKNNAKKFDAVKYRFDNLPSNLMKDDMDLIKDMFLIHDEYDCYLPLARDRVYYSVIDEDKQVGIGLSTHAFKCGLRVPLHYFYDILLEDYKIGLGQLLPNSFLHINSFIDRCRERDVSLQKRLFWHHYRLSTSAKCQGFFSIGYKNASQQWVNTYTNNRGSHEECFYLVGPLMRKYTSWDDFIPITINPELNDVERKDYDKLIKPHDKSMIMTPAFLKNEKFLLLNKVSCIGMEEDLVNHRLLEQARAEKELRKRKQAKGKASKSRPLAEPIQSEGKEAISKEPSKMVDVAEVSLEELNYTSKRKKTKASINLPPTPEQLLENASSSSIAFGKQLGHSISLPGTVDQAKIIRKDSVACGKEARAFASQTLLWISQQIFKSEDESVQRVALEKAADDANNRATDEKLRADAAGKNLLREIKASKDHEADLNKRISELEKKLRDAEEAKLDAQAHWYKIGANKRLDKIKEAGFDHTKCLFEFEEEFDDDDDQEKSPQEDADEN